MGVKSRRSYRAWTESDQQPHHLRDFAYRVEVNQFQQAFREVGMIMPSHSEAVKLHGLRFCFGRSTESVCVADAQLTASFTLASLWLRCVAAWAKRCWRLSTDSPSIYQRYLPEKKAPSSDDRLLACA